MSPMLTLIIFLAGAFGLMFAIEKFKNSGVGVALLLAFTSDITLFTLWRFLAGVGLGGALPTAIAMVTEFRPGTKAGSASTTLMTGYHVGAVATAFLGILLIEPLGWHSMFIAGAIPGLVLVPLLYFLLPESPQFLLSTGRAEKAREIATAYGLNLDDDLDRARLYRERGRLREEHDHDPR